MPRPNINDRYLETTSRADKYEVGQLLNRWGKWVEVTRIEEEKDGSGWRVYVKDAT